MILYFTGTGNSKYAADMLTEALNDEEVSLNNVIKNHLTLSFHSEKPFVLCAPIYAWRFPKVVEDVLWGSSFVGSHNFYFIGTMGLNSGNCDKYCEKLCTKKCLGFMGFSGVVMPSNYLPTGVPTKREVDDKLAAAQLTLGALAERIKSGERIEKTDVTSLSWLKTNAVHPLFSAFVGQKNYYTVSDACVGCGLCAALCPTDNVTLRNHRPEFGGKCISCFCCIQRCPMHAINIKGKTEYMGRYVCQKYKKQDKG